MSVDYFIISDIKSSNVLIAFDNFELGHRKIKKVGINYYIKHILRKLLPTLVFQNSLTILMARL